MLKAVPDTVEELAVGPDNRSLDAEWLRFKLGDADEHALEEALLLKEKYGGTVTVVALDAPELDDALYAAAAKGADRIVKLTGDLAAVQSFGAARLLAEFLRPAGEPLAADTLVLVRSQAMDDLEGEIGPFLANLLEVPYLGVVTAVAVAGGELTVIKEFAGGWRGEFALPLPAVVGVQSAEKPPRYVPFAKVRAAMKTAAIEAVEVVPAAARTEIARLYKPEVAARAEMLAGSAAEVADRLVAVLAEHNLLGKG